MGGASFCQRFSTKTNEDLAYESPRYVLRLDCFSASSSEGSSMVDGIKSVTTRDYFGREVSVWFAEDGGKFSSEFMEASFEFLCIVSSISSQ